MNNIGQTALVQVVLLLAKSKMEATSRAQKHWNNSGRYEDRFALPPAGRIISIGNTPGPDKDNIYTGRKKHNLTKIHKFITALFVSCLGISPSPFSQQSIILA